jgi:hypothetical protein
MSAVQTGTPWRVASTRMPTKWGMFDAIGFERDVSKKTRGVETALALVMGDLTEGFHYFESIRSASQEKSSGRCAVIAMTSWKWPCGPSPKNVAGS